MKYFFIFLLIFLGSSSTQLFAQNITGVWEGKMSDEFLRLNIVQEGNNLCGYTFDILINDKSSYCKSYFTGKYDKKNDRYVINGIKFIENSGDHVLMTIRLWFPSQSSNRNKLLGSVSVVSSSLLSALIGEGDLFSVKKVSDNPVKPGKYLPVCYEYNPPLITKTEELKRKQTPKPDKISETPATIEKTIQSDTSRPSPKIVVNDPITKEIPSVKPENEMAITREMNSRRNNAVSTIKVDVEKIRIQLYDNGTIDNDSVSVFYNGRLLKKHEKLSDKPVVIDLELDKNVKSHELVMFAENLGTFPPNTALIVVTAGKKRFELHSKASLSENAVLNFEYEP